MTLAAATPSLAQQQTWLLATSVVLGVLALVVILQMVQLRALRRQLDLVLRDVQGESLVDALNQHFAERRELRQQHQSMSERLTDVESRLRTSKRFLSVVRFDAFDDVSGQQSFAVAAYDDEGHGVVLSNVVGRSHNRIYAKEMVDGQNPLGWSDEEKQAIQQAAHRRTRTGGAS